MLSLFFPQMKVNGFAVPGLACGVERKSHFSQAYSCSAQSKEDSLEKKMGGNCPDLEIFLCSDFFRKRLDLSYASLKGMREHHWNRIF